MKPQGKSKIRILSSIQDNKELGLLLVNGKNIEGDAKTCIYKTLDGESTFKCASIMHTSYESVKQGFVGLALERISETRPLKEGDILIECDGDAKNGKQQ